MRYDRLFHLLPLTLACGLAPQAAWAQSAEVLIGFSTAVMEADDAPDAAAGCGPGQAPVRMMLTGKNRKGFRVSGALAERAQGAVTIRKGGIAQSKDQQRELPRLGVNFDPVFRSRGAPGTAELSGWITACADGSGLSIRGGAFEITGIGEHYALDFNETLDGLSDRRGAGIVIRYDHEIFAAGPEFARPAWLAPGLDGGDAAIRGRLFITTSPFAWEFSALDLHGAPTTGTLQLSLGLTVIARPAGGSASAQSDR